MGKISEDAANYELLVAYNVPEICKADEVFSLHLHLHGGVELF